MIQTITPERAVNITDILQLYCDAKNRIENYYLNAGWIDYIVTRLKTGEKSGLLYRGNKNEGLVLFQSGPRTVFVSQLFVRRGADRNAIFRRLLRGLINKFNDKIIMIAEPAPGFSSDLQKELFSACGFKVGSRYEMFRPVDGHNIRCDRPRGFQFKKFRAGYIDQLNRLDREAYRGEPDEILFEIVEDIGNFTPALKIVNSYLGRFNKSLSEFVFYGERLAGAIYCVERGDDLLVANIATAPRYRKLGLATLLLSKVLNRLRVTDYGGCRLFVTADNHKAINLYKKFKFKVERNRIYCVYHSRQGE